MQMKLILREDVPALGKRETWWTFAAAMDATSSCPRARQ